MKGVDDMDTENNNMELDERVNLPDTNQIDPKTNDELKNAVEETLSKIRRQSMLLGCQVICKTIMDKIYDFESSHGKKSANDYKRCLKDIKQFCEVGLSRKVNTDGTTEPTEKTDLETAQN